MFKFDKEFRKDNPQTVGETDAHFDLDNYKDWIEEKLEKSKDEIIEFGFWLTQNCTPSGSEDGWWVFKDIWLTTDECLVRFRESVSNAR